jgi:hypothetical protein
MWKLHRYKFSKVPSILTSISKCTRALTFENFLQGSLVYALYPRKRRGHAVTVDPDGENIFIFGGLTRYGNADVYLNDVWSTAGNCAILASCWTRVVEEGHNGWYGRYLHSALVYQNSFWIVGGQYCGGPVDGQGLETTPLLAGGRRGSSTLCGRSSRPTHLGDVWVSSGKEIGANGKRGLMWNQATAQAQWGRRSALVAVNFDNRFYTPRPVLPARTNMWVLGGMDGYTDAHNQTTIAFEF